MAESRGIKIFLGHASDDKAAVLSLYERLQAQGYDPWIDKLNLLPGDNWREEIPKAIKSSDIFIACLSPRSVDKDGYVQQELRIALMECARKSVKGVYLIPLRLEPCEIPDLQLLDLGVNLRDYHWLDYWESGSFELLVRSIERKRPSLPSASSPSPTSSSSAPSPSPPSPAAVSPPESPSDWPKVQLERFSFEVVTVDAKGQETDRRTESADHFLENVGDGVFLDMVRIPGGEFLMGSPEDEPDRGFGEGPQHRVIVPEFFMGRYPVTQSQWRVAALLQPVKRDLYTDPSHFKGSNRPVEYVSWHEAIEYCDRLTLLTGHQYSLPHESQWEYACRAGTTTAFNLGMTLTSEIANYWATHCYAEGSPGNYRKQTTEVGHFPSNRFGLQDMHGNVREWCQDIWHENYEAFPIDANAYLAKDSNHSRVIRGGSWASYPRHCRSAFRYHDLPHVQVIHLGFRVVCSVPRT